MKFPPKLIEGQRRLKFLAYPNGTKRVGVEDLVSKGWTVLAETPPMPDGLVYTLLGQSDVTPEEQSAKIARLEAELAALKGAAE